MKRFLQIGNLSISINEAASINLDSSFEKFAVLPDNCSDNVIFEIKADRFKLPDKAKQLSNDYIRIYEADEKIYRVFSYANDGENKEIFIVRNKRFDSRYDIFINPDIREFKLKPPHLPLEEILAYHRGILLHSSYIVHNGQAILFSAPSGTGKTTQAKLWETYAGADIINGDRCAIMKIDGRWCACGCFYKGSSSYCENVTAPIKAIITLEQGRENSSYTLNEMEKFKALYRESLVHTWNAEYVELLVDTIMECASEIRMEHFTCLPDESAVRYVKNLIYNN